jgi:hypothetical protein
MKFKVDENLTIEVADVLRREGHDAATVLEQQAVAQLSSRVDPHPRRAVFVYHWSSFRGNPSEILTKYYDAMLYEAN